MTACEPLVGPSENKSAGDTCLESCVHLPGQDLPLPLLALAERIDTEFGQDQRLIEGDIVQPRDISAEGGLVVQVDVETDEVGEIDGKIFGRWVIGIADERVRVLGLGADNQASEKAAYRLGTVPAYHIGRYLIADQIGEDRRMAAASTDALPHCLTDLAAYRRAVEKSNVLRPRKSDENLQTFLLRGIEQP